MKRLFTIISLIGFTVLHAQNKSNDTTAKYFLIQASIGNLQETAMGKLAAKKSVNPDVKAFATQMVADHSSAQIQLMQVIRSTGIQIPAEATDTPVENMRLKDIAEKDFDRMYVHMMVPDHRETVNLFENYALTGENPIVKAFAQQALPMLKKHLAAIIDIEDNINRSSSK